MAQENIDFGGFPDDPSADAIRTAFNKVQNNFNQLFSTNAGSTVNSINRTPGAGITVNYPTGNVVISANLAALNVTTSSLSIGRGSNGNTAANITSTAQTLVVDIDPSNVFSNNFATPGGGLANFNGILTSNSANQPNITRVGTLTTLTVSGNANITGNAIFTGTANFNGSGINFSNISNIHIPGGIIGQYIQTDGNGSLIWAYGGGNGGGSPGGVNTYVQFNDAGSFGANAGFTFDKVTGILSTPSLNVSNSAIIGNLVGALSNGNSNVNIPVANGNVNISAAGNANIIVVTGVGVNVASNINVEDNIVANRIEVNLITGVLTTNAQPNVTSVGTLTNLTIANGGIGNLIADNANLGNLVQANYFTGTLTTNAQPNITSVGNLSSLVVDGNANVSNLNVANNVIINGNLSVLGNATYINIESLEVEDPIISLGGGPNGDPLIANDGKDRGTALQYYTTLPVTAFMGWDNSNAEFAFGSNVTIASEIVTFTNLGNIRASYFIGDNTQFGNANLGNTATANYFVGNLYGTANAAIVANTVVDNAQPNITSVGTLTSLVVTGNTTSGNFVGTLANGNSNVRIEADSNIGFSAVGNSNVVTITGTGMNVAGTGNFTGNLTVGNLLGPLTNGNSNVQIPSANGNVNLTAAGNTSLVVTGTGINVAGTLNSTGNATVGNLETAQVLATANITAPQLISNVATGTAPLVVTSTTQVANLNAATAGLATFATTANAVAGANVSGTVANATYAVTSGTANAVAGANVSGQVGNALVAGTVYTNAQPNITSVGTLTSLGVSGTTTGAAFTANTGVFTGNGNGLSSLVGANVTGAVSFATTANSVAGANVSGTVANATYAVTAGTANSVAGANVSGQVGNALVAGTVYTNAQPNITSVGTLTSLGVSGNITAANITANTGVFTGNGNGLSSLVGANVTGTVANATYAVTAGTANAVAGANVSGQVANALVAGTVYTAAQSNITSVGTLTSLGVSGNITAANITANTGVFTGNGNGLSSLVGANVTGAVSFATTANAVAGANVSGAVAFATTANSVAGANVSGTVANATYAVTAGTAFSVSAGNISGTVNLANFATTANAVAGANVSGAVSFATTANAVAGSNVSGAVGSATNAAAVLQNTSSSTTVYPTFSTSSANGNSSAVINTNISANLGNASITATTFVGALSGAATTAGTVTTAAQPNITSTGTLTSLTVSGTTNLGAVSNVTITGGTSGYYLQTNGSGGLSWAAVPSGTGIANGTSNINIPTSGGNISMFSAGNNTVTITGTGANITGTANITGNANVGNIGAAAGVFTTVAGSLITAAQPNITSVGTLTSLAVTGNITAGNVTGANLVSANFLTGTLTTAAQPNITSTGTLTSLTVTGNISAANVTATHYGAATGLTGIPGANVTGTVANATYAVTSGGSNSVAGANVTGTVANATYAVTAGTANSVAGANVSGQVANALVAGTVYTAAQPNITSVGTLTGFRSNGIVNFTTASNVSLGSNANVKITGGAAGDVLVTVNPTTGELAWGTITFDRLDNGNTSLVLTQDGNITMFIAGNANARFTATTTGIVANGTFSLSGNANVGNIGATRAVVTAVLASANVTAPRLISNVATGTAPLTISSTTQVPNLHAALAGTVTTPAQPNITSVGTLLGLTSEGSILPSANITYDLGSDTQRWKDLWLSNTTIYLGNSGATISANSSSVLITNPGGTTVPLKPGGSNTQVQFNTDGIFGASSALTWNDGTTTLTANNITVTNNINTGGFVLRSVRNNIIAAGSTQGTASSIVKEMNIVSVVSSGANGVILPTPSAGAVLTITNTTANTLRVYPASGGQINVLGTNIAYNLGTATIQFIAPTSTQWYTVG